MRLYLLIRQYLTSLGLQEVQTPSLSKGIIPEASIDVFAIDQLSPQLEQTSMFLLPSPEYYMKQMLAEGFGSIFQLSRCYRRGEVNTDRHLCEFTMLEWYAVDADYHDSLKMQEELLQHILDDARLWEMVSQLPISPEQISRQRSIIQPPCQRISLQAAFEKWANIDLSQAIQCGAFPASDHLIDRQQESFADAFHRILCDRIEPQLPTDQPVILIDYPSAIPSTAKKDGLWSQRWELYLGGMEIANCYTEADSSQTAQLCAQESLELEAMGRAGQTDKGFAKKIASMPPCSGNAIGIDRLLMCICAEKHIEGVIFFPPHANLGE